MQNFDNYGDLRQLSRCVYCGGPTETRDHVPSRVLLDEPFPANLPVVPACKSCNQGFSLDEEYLACLVDSALVGSARPNEGHRPKIRKVLERKPALVSLLTNATCQTDTGPVFYADSIRANHVVTKLARGHAAYELNEPQFETPMTLRFVPFTLMHSEQRELFETPIPTWGGPGVGNRVMWPEVGSRAMQRLVLSFPPAADWNIVQAGRYRYMAVVGDGIVVRMVLLSEYLACEVVWCL